MAALILRDKLVVHSPQGTREIQLLFGDITELPPEDKVDIIMISAFAADYTATPTSVIGALKRAFDLSVRDLARNKADDMRRHFNCWLSHPLAGNLPYRRLLCFERGVLNFEHPAMLVGDVFRCLVPAFNNEPSSVITPLLSTGDQRFSKPRMLKSIVKAAVNWINAGLPMEVLKIVVYSSRPEKMNAEETLLTTEFDALKRKWSVKPVVEKEPDIVYDVYLSYSMRDLDHVNEVEQILKTENSDIKVYKEHQQIDQESVWQKNMFNTMITCKRIITFLSPNFLECLDCLEQYNIAVCCERNTARSILAPFYVETIATIPSYMCLVQYVDIRIKDHQIEKRIQNCKAFVKLLSEDIHTRSSIHKEYDIFISYSHRNNEKAEKFLSMLSKIDPYLRIFYDREELKIGSIWQNALYESVDSSTCVVALLSPDYLTSLVCQEEYSLALIKHFEHDHCRLVPVCIEDIPSVPIQFCSVKAIDARKGKFERVLLNVCQHLIGFIKKPGMMELFRALDVKDELVIADEILYKYRKKYFQEHFEHHLNFDKHTPPLNQTQSEHTTSTNQLHSGSNVSCDVGFSYCADTKTHARFLNKLLQLRAPRLKTNFLVKKSDKSFTDSLENAKLIVPFISPSYIHQAKEVEELHLALLRHRSSKDGQVIYPIQVSCLPFKPTYIRMIPCCVACQDQHWTEVHAEAVQQGSNLFDQDVQLAKMDTLSHATNVLTSEDMLALSMAAYDITVLLKTNSAITKTTIINIIELKNHLAENPEPGDLPLEDLIAEIHIESPIMKPHKDTEIDHWKQTALLTEIVNARNQNTHNDGVSTQDVQPPTSQRRGVRRGVHTKACTVL